MYLSLFHQDEMYSKPFAQKLYMVKRLGGGAIYFL